LLNLVLWTSTASVNSLLSLNGSTLRFKVALEALQEKQTLAEIASKYELHSSQISDWKQQVLTTGGGLFESDKSVKLSSTKADNSDKLYE